MKSLGASQVKCLQELDIPDRKICRFGEPEKRSANLLGQEPGDVSSPTIRSSGFWTSATSATVEQEEPRITYK